MGNAPRRASDALNNRKTEETDAAALRSTPDLLHLNGPENGHVVCFTHSLASDGGMWAEQVPALLGAGYRVLRVDMRGHGGSDPVAWRLHDGAARRRRCDGGRFSRHRQGRSSSACRSAACSARPSPSSTGQRLISMMLCDTLPPTPPGAQETWAPRIEAVKEANGLATRRRHHGALVHRRLQGRNPGRWKQINATIVGTTAPGYLGCAAAILNFDFLATLPTLKVPTLVVCGAKDEGTPPAGNKHIAELVPGGRYEEIADARHFPNVEHPDVFNRILLGWLEAQR